MAGDRRIARKLAFSERALPWLGATAAGVAILTTVALLAKDGGLGARPDQHVLRGYTPVGIFLGIAAVVLGLVASVYSLRKRPLQERFSKESGPMTTWLWLHVGVGLVALAAALLHAGYGLVSTELTTGKVVVLIFVLLALSGVGWRIAYRVVPPRVAPVIGNYARSASASRAEALAVEIAKATAGGSAELHRIAAWLVDAPRSDQEIAAALEPLSPDERSRVDEVRAAADARRRALARMSKQESAVRWLQAWRVVHVPLTLLAVPALVVHVVGALEVHVAVAGPGDAPLRELSGLHPSSGCASCHRAIVAQWSGSMHAHAMKSPVTLAQNNQLLASAYRAEASPDPKHICVNCHGPVAVASTGRARLPLHRTGYEEAFLAEGVGCSSCHQWRGAESVGSAGLAKFQSGLRPGSVQLGAIADPVGNAFHQSRPASIFTRDGGLCANCHDVVYDKNGDGKLEKGIDLVLQTTVDEYAAYAARGGRPTCVGCHMPVVAGATRAAERASIPTQQDTEAPARVVHDHSFVGVDYPIDEVAARDPQRAAREELLRGAARLDLDPAPAIKGGDLVISVAITNTGVGHDLPSGFAFARQMWLEVKVDGDHRTLFTSGVLARSSDDLCDAGTFDEADNPARRFMVGCTASDRQLVSFQQKLFDHVEVDRDRAGNPKLDARGATRAAAAPGAKEAWLQYLTAGAVPRVRPVDGAVLAPIAPDETRRFVYRVPVGAARSLTASVRLLFRSLAPYMLRAIGSGQPSDEVRLEPLVENLQVVEMASRSIVTAGR